jgi:hypothetical protein
MQILIDQDIKILHLYGHDQITDPSARAALLRDVETARRKARERVGIESQLDLVTEEKGIRIFAPDLAVGETYWVVFELSLPPDKSMSQVGKAVIQYVDVFAGGNKRHELDLLISGTIPADVVTLHGLGLWTSEVTFYALDDLYQRDLDTAQTRLAKHIQVLESAKAHLAAVQLSDDIVSLRKLVSLTGNLGKVRRFSEDLASGPAGYAVYGLSSFGQVRNGYIRAQFPG